MSLQLASLFSDHMVLQRNRRVPVWGCATPGASVTVRFAGQSRTAKAGRDGRWSTRLASLPASTCPRVLEVASKAQTEAITLRIHDVLVGDVWICSGQSNMEWPLGSSRDAVAETAAADYPAIRLFTVPRTANVPAAESVAGAWSRCTPDTVGPFSAVGYFFGRKIHRTTGIPIGLINTSWGGTIAEAWTNRDDLLRVPAFRRVVKGYEAELVTPDAPRLSLAERHQEWARLHEHKDTCNAGEAQGWHLPDASTADWRDMELPRNWQSAGHEHSGIFWFRRDVDIPAEWVGRDLTLALGPTDKSDVTYVNGQRVGSITMEQRPDAWCTPRVYTVPASCVHAGRNTIAVRVYSNIFHGGFIGVPSQMRLCPSDAPETPLALAGIWRYAIEANFGLVPPPPPPPRGPGNPNSPYMLFENMIRPLIPYAVCGAIWYQGESNASQARQYRTLFPLMINSWRRAWNQGAFPFFFVQLANYMLRKEFPEPSAWAELREAQAATLALPNTGMAVTIDVGEANDIHPRNKQDVGRRLALAALATVYGLKGLVYSGPLYKAMSREKGRIRLRFDHVGGGLVARGGGLSGFSVAGTDRKFVWADAVIDGDTVVVSSPSVPKPVAVRYAWADNPACTLYNTSELPASPFRTDSWPGITA